MARENKAVIQVIGVLIIGALFFFPLETKEKDFLELQFYDKDGNKIFDTSTFATVEMGGQTYQEIAYISFNVNMVNTGDLPITITFDSVTPIAFDNTLTQTSKILQVGQSASWQSGLIDVEQFVSGTQVFYVKAKAVSGSKVLYKDASITLTFSGDPEIDFDINIDGGTNESSGVGGGILYGANIWGEIPDNPTEKEKVSNLYEVVSSSKWNYAFIQQVKQYSPETTTLMYKTIACNIMDDDGVCKGILVDHPEWMLYQDGEYVCDPYHDGTPEENTFCYMDISNSEVRQLMIDFYLRHLNERPMYDGLWVDIAPSSLNYYGGATDKIQTDQEAFNSYKLWLIEVKQALNSEGYLFILEWSAMSDEGNNWNLLTPYTNGVYEEAFYYNWGGVGNKKSQAQIDKQLQDCKYTVTLGKQYFAGLYGIINVNENDWLPYIQEAYDVLKEGCGEENVGLWSPSYRLGRSAVGVDIFNQIK